MLSPGHFAKRHATPLPLVLLPGTLCDARLFAPLQARLPGIDTRVVSLAHACSMQQAAEQVLAQAPPRFALLGFSLGGMVAMEAALCAPERVHALALLSTTPLPVPPARHAARREAAEQARTLGMASFLRQQMWPDYCGAVEHAAMLPLLEAMADTLGHETFAWQTGLALSRQDFRPRLPAIRCTTLILAGAEDKLCPPAAQHELAAALPACISVMLPDAGHFVLLERPDEVATAVAAWFHTAQGDAEDTTEQTSRPIHIREIE